MRKHSLSRGAFFAALTTALVLSGCGGGSDDGATPDLQAAQRVDENGPEAQAESLFGSPPLALKGPDAETDTGSQADADPAM